MGHVFEFDMDLYEEYIAFQDVLDTIDPSNQSLYDTQDKFEFKVNSEVWINIIYSKCVHKTCDIHLRLHRNVKIYLFDVNGDILMLIVWKYSIFEKHVMVIVAYSTM